MEKEPAVVSKCGEGVVMCPNCGAQLKRWDELGDAEKSRIKALSGRDAQNLEHRTSRHLFCPSCYYEAHG